MTPRHGTGATVALVALSATPVGWYQTGFESQLIRLARELSAARATEVLVVPWLQLRFVDDGVLVCGPGLSAVGRNVRPLAASERRRADALLTFPSEPIGPHGPSPTEVEALRRLAADGIDTDVANRSQLVRRILAEAARRGVATNAPGPQGRLGAKDRLELALRTYELVSGARIPRPRTLTARTPDVARALSILAARGATAVVKPAHGARGEGIQIVAPGRRWDASTARPRMRWVVQELVAAPLCVGGHKADLRVYLAVDTGSPAATRRLSPTLVRVAAGPYEPGAPASEITNTAYRRQLGLPPSICGLEHVDLPPPVRRAVVQGVDAVIDTLLEALRWWLVGSRFVPPDEPRRALLWAIDLIARSDGDALEVGVLELNAHPTLLRGQYLPDWQVARMIRREFLPVVLARRG